MQLMPMAAIKPAKKPHHMALVRLMAVRGLSTWAGSENEIMRGVRLEIPQFNVRRPSVPAQLATVWL